jgi:hypothetical protein
MKMCIFNPLNCWCKRFDRALVCSQCGYKSHPFRGGRLRFDLSFGANRGNYHGFDSTTWLYVLSYEPLTFRVCVRSAILCEIAGGGVGLASIPYPPPGQKIRGSLKKYYYNINEHMTGDKTFRPDPGSQWNVLDLWPILQRGPKWNFLKTEH